MALTLTWLQQRGKASDPQPGHGLHPREVAGLHQIPKAVHMALTKARLWLQAPPLSWSWVGNLRLLREKAFSPEGREHYPTGSLRSILEELLIGMDRWNQEQFEFLRAQGDHRGSLAGRDTEEPTSGVGGTPQGTGTCP
ncbi:hypothetical protein UY3_16838 [Chelonia mydas]|uniref:Uncharacterized protein n=1 Tax=Chelonia mydas TaxID=8469 RepID=M7AT35_CHEMY|nr:hypothetical protein UY3_16838 [Chelonia mydas]